MKEKGDKQVALDNNTLISALANQQVSKRFKLCKDKQRRQDKEIKSLKKEFKRLKKSILATCLMESCTSWKMPSPGMKCSTIHIGWLGQASLGPSKCETPPGNYI